MQCCWNQTLRNRIFRATHESLYPRNCRCVVRVPAWNITLEILMKIIYSIRTHSLIHFSLSTILHNTRHKENESVLLMARCNLSSLMLKWNVWNITLTKSFGWCSSQPHVLGGTHNYQWNIFDRARSRLDNEKRRVHSRVLIYQYYLIFCR